MQPGSDEERFERILRWMITNLEISSSVYRSPSAELLVDTELSREPSGEYVRKGSGSPPNFEDWELNSASGLLACCYIDALGKVLHRGNGNPGNVERMKKFIAEHMKDLEAECEEHGDEMTLDMFCKLYRHGFVHQFADYDAHWGRDGRTKPYLYRRNGSLVLNLDRFAEGTVHAIRGFRSQFPESAANKPDPYRKFTKWLTGA